MADYLVLEPDVLVIGGGAAGAMAAATASKLGNQVVLVRRGYGATAMTAGATELTPARHWWQRLASAETTFDEAIATFIALTNQGGCPYTLSQPITLLTALGLPYRASLVAAAAVGGDIESWDGGRVLFVGIAGMPAHNPAHLARCATALSAGSAVAPDRARTPREQNRPSTRATETGHTEVFLPGVHRSHNLTPFEVAALLDDPAVAEAVAEQVAQAAQEGSYTHVALPPVIGLERATETITLFQSMCPVTCFELLAGLPSVPGFRLQQALDQALQALGVPIVHAAVERVSTKGGQITEVEARWKETRYCFRPQQVILATGKFVGGGLSHEERLRESLLDLPLFVGKTLIECSDLQPLLDENFRAAQPVMAVGVRVDATMRPVDTAGQPVYANLRAAGAVLSGESHAGSGGLALALVSGYLAGQAAGRCPP